MSSAVQSVVERLEGRQLLAANPLDTHVVRWDGQQVEAIRDRYVVHTRDGRDFARFADRNDLPVTDVKSLGGGFFGFSSDAGARNINRWAAKYRHGIRAIAPSVLFEKRASTDDPLYPEQWHHVNTGQSAPTLTQTAAVPQAGRPGADMDTDLAWDITRGYSDADGNDNNDVIIAVLDTGIDTTHPDLVANLYTNPNEIAADGIDNDDNGVIDDVHGYNPSGVIDLNQPSLAGDPTDDDGHGTHVSGIIGATGNNGLGVSGVAQRVKILPVKVLGVNGGSTEGIIAGIRYVTRMKAAGANIVALNASLGISPLAQSLFDEVYSAAFEQAGDAGVMSVVAAGNDTVNTDTSPVYPARFSLNLPSVVTVASTDNHDKASVFSNTGQESVLLAAPGDGILSTMPTYSIPTGGLPPYDPSDPIGTPYSFISGTSMAAPQVAGVVALMASVRPGATVAELKHALAQSVQELDSLDAPYSSPFLVRTGGRVNAYRAVRAIQNTHAGDDAGTSGGWQGKYGAEGYWLPGLTAAPAYATIDRVNGGSERSAPSSAPRPVLLDHPTESGKYTRVVRTSGSTTFDVNLTDGQTHRVSFYTASLDGRGGGLEYKLYDATSQAEIGTYNVSGHARGRYVSFDLTGHVLVRVRRTGGGGDANVLGVFFDPAPSTPQVMLGTDRKTGGDWQERYGGEGAMLVGKDAGFPGGPGVTGGITGGRRQTFSTFSEDRAALVRKDATGGRVAGFYKGSSMVVDLDFADDEKHVVTLYAADLDRRNRAQRFELVDTATGQVIDRRNISNFAKGQYLTWTVSGEQQIRVTRLAGPDAVINGVFFDRPGATNGSFVGVDSETGGEWRRGMGWTSAWIVDDTDRTVNGTATGLPVGVTMTVGDDAMKRTIRRRSTNPAALERRDSDERIEAQYESRTSFDVDLDVTGPLAQRVSFYAADYENRGHKQRIDVFDAETGERLGTAYMTNLSGGQYATFDISGPVRVEITNLAGNAQRAVLSGVFFG